MIEAGFDELRRGRSTRGCVLLEYTVVDGEQVAFERRGRLVELFRVKEVRPPDRMPSRVQWILLHGASHFGGGFLETSKPAKIETGVNPPRVA